MHDLVMVKSLFCVSENILWFHSIMHTTSSSELSSKTVRCIKGYSFKLGACTYDLQTQGDHLVLAILHGIASFIRSYLKV